MKKKSEGADAYQRPISPEEIVKEANRLCNEVLRPIIANIDEIQWMRANGWLNIECKVEKTERLIRIECPKFLQDEINSNQIKKETSK